MMKQYFVSLLALLLVGCSIGVETAVSTPPAPAATAAPRNTPTNAPTIAAPAQPTDKPLAEPTEEPMTESSEATAEADADVTNVRAVQTAPETWTFHVTVMHPDTGWEDYADGWDVVLPDGMVILPNGSDPFTRLLLHPHETEQPFTRSQSNISIPANVTTVTVRAHDLVHGFGGQEVTVDLTAVTGENFTVEQ